MFCFYFQCHLNLILYDSFLHLYLLFFQKPGFKGGRKHSYLGEANLYYLNLNSLQYETIMKRVNAQN